MDDQPGSDRVLPSALRDAWELAVGHDDPLIALAAARALRAHLATWEAQLAAEAFGAGSTWEMIGEAIGASRQAAWERFRAHVPQRQTKKPTSSYEAELRRLRDEVRRLKRAGRSPRA